MGEARRTSMALLQRTVAAGDQPTARQHMNELAERIEAITPLLAQMCGDKNLGDAVEIYAAAIAAVLHGRTSTGKAREQRDRVFAAFIDAVKDSYQFLDEQEATRTVAPAGSA